MNDLFQTEDLSPDLKTFLDRCLMVNVEERADAGELLSHAFIRNNGGSVSTLVPNIKATKDKDKRLI